jgi:hypothetical protein
LYALAAAKLVIEGEREPGVAGVRWAQRKLTEHGHLGTIDFSAHADPDGAGAKYLQQPWGAFGADYESQLMETGVLGKAEAHDCQ